MRAPTRAWFFPPETVGKYLPLSGWIISLERSKHHPVACLWQRSPIPRAVEHYEGAAFVPGRKLVSVIKQQTIRCPVCGEGHERIFHLGAPSLPLSVTAVLRSQKLAFRLRLVVTVRPANVVPVLDSDEFFRRILGVVMVVEGIPTAEGVATVNHSIESAVVWP